MTVWVDWDERKWGRMCWAAFLISASVTLPREFTKFLLKKKIEKIFLVMPASLMKKCPLTCWTVSLFVWSRPWQSAPPGPPPSPPSLSSCRSVTPWPRLPSPHPTHHHHQHTSGGSPGLSGRLQLVSRIWREDDIEENLSTLSPGQTECCSSLGDAESQADTIGETRTPDLVIHSVWQVLQHHSLCSSLGE